MTGISYNGLRPLDLAYEKSERTRVRGDIRPLTSIPYDYKAQNPELFVDVGVQSTSVFSHDGSGSNIFIT